MTKWKLTRIMGMGIAGAGGFLLMHVPQYEEAMFLANSSLGMIALGLIAVTLSFLLNQAGGED
ncbi:MAG: hypothetical protein HQL52_08190 [Magnetococcales bacterium]|nr:hypothetical protein [Magnetococcales bacterium]